MAMFSSVVYSSDNTRFLNGVFIKVRQQCIVMPDGKAIDKGYFKIFNTFTRFHFMQVGLSTTYCIEL